MAKVAWTAEAHLWLRDIHDYIAAENPAAADRVSLDEQPSLARHARYEPVARLQLGRH